MENNHIPALVACVATFAGMWFGYAIGCIRGYVLGLEKGMLRERNRQEMMDQDQADDKS